MVVPEIRPDDARAAAVAEVIHAAGELVASGVPREQAAATLADVVPNRAALAGAQTEIAHRMHTLPSNDFAATATLRLVLVALRLVPYDDVQRA